MPTADRFEIQSIGGKEIYLVEKHQYALKGWYLEQKERKTDILITLDNHRDTHVGFGLHLSKENGYSPTDSRKAADDYVKSLGDLNNIDIDDIITKLYHDEQIDAAIRMGIFNRSYVIYNGNETEDIKNIDVIPWDKYYCGPWKDLREVQKNMFHSDFLGGKIAHIIAVEDCHLRKLRYVLDIDCDYVHYRETLNPTDIDVFSLLVENASCITIARETTYIEDFQEPDEDPTYEYENGIKAEEVENGILDLISRILK